MSPTHNPGRIAGFWYLLLVVIGPLRLIYIPNKLFVHGSATATADNIAAHEWLFRSGMVGDLLGAVILIFLTLAFYRLFKGVSEHLAVLVVVLGGVMPSLLYFVFIVAATLRLGLPRSRWSRYSGNVSKPQVLPVGQRSNGPPGLISVAGVLCHLPKAAVA